MNQLQRWCICLRRIGHCQGFGIQSPNDYWFVRYVVNEHWPYYQYDSVGLGDKWLTKKTGRLCLRIANWRQPATVICSEELKPYIHAGCQRAEVTTEGTKADMAVIETENEERVMQTANSMDEAGILIVRDIAHHPELWQRIASLERTRVMFDLYYCGIVFFDQKRKKQNYIINF